MEHMLGPFVASPLFSDDRVVIVSENYNVYCFNRKDGKLYGHIKTWPIAGSPVIAGNF
jgi:outer membrane protein assembly factor BamB